MRCFHTPMFRLPSVPESSLGIRFRLMPVCVKVTPGSAGEAHCKSCRLSFEFEVDSQARNTTGVRVKTAD